MPSFEESRFQSGLFAAPDRILVATDLTDGDYLIPHVVAQAKASNARVTLVHGILPANLLPMEAGALSIVEQEQIDAQVRSILLGIAARIQQHGVACDIVAEHGFAADVIRQQIKITGAQRLIMGTHGRRGLAQMALGSVARELLSSTNIPILAIGPHVGGGAGNGIPRAILHPSSLRGDYRTTAAFAIDLAQAYRADLTLMHVVEPNGGDSLDRAQVLNRAGHDLSALAPNGEDLVPPIYTTVSCGNRVEEILHAASQINAGWIVVGVDAPVSFSPLRSSTAYKVLSAATCPVLAFPHAARVAIQSRQEETTRLIHA